MLFAISSHAAFRSLWLINVPAEPASRRVSGGIHPVVGPGSTASTCCANTGTWTSFATYAMSVVGGQSTIDAPVSSATAANLLARSQPFFPRTSGWVLKFRTIEGRRMPLQEGTGVGNRLGRDRADVSDRDPYLTIRLSAAKFDVGKASERLVPGQEPGPEATGDRVPDRVRVR